MLLLVVGCELDPARLPDAWGDDPTDDGSVGSGIDELPGEASQNNAGNNLPGDASQNNASNNLPGDASPSEEPDQMVGPEQPSDEPQLCADEPGVCCSERLFTVVERGRLVHQMCAADQVCREGIGCVEPLDEVCQGGDELELSHERMLFMPKDDGEPTTQSLHLTNCTGADIRIKPLTVKSHLGASGRAQVFRLGSGTWLEPIDLGPGAQERVPVVFQQRAPQWREDGVVEIEYARFKDRQGNPVYERKVVLLQTQTECLTYPERLDYPFDVVHGQQFSVTIPVMNCGTVALEDVALVSVAASAEDATGPEAYDPGIEDSMSLEPGEAGMFKVEVLYDKTRSVEGSRSVPVMGPSRMFFQPIADGRPLEPIDIHFDVYEKSNVSESPRFRVEEEPLTGDILVESSSSGMSLGGPEIGDNFKVFLDAGDEDLPDPYPSYELTHEPLVPLESWFYSSFDCAQLADYPQDCVPQGDDALGWGWNVDLSLHAAELPVNEESFLPQTMLSGRDALRRRDNRSFSFRPRVAGRYHVTWRVVPPSGSAHGGERHGEIEVKPSPNTPIYVELTWHARGSGFVGDRENLRDEVPADERVNASADLDLHVLAIPRDRPSLQGDLACFWDSRFDCSVKSQYFAREHDTIPACLSKVGGVPIAQMYRSSISGGDPEVVRVLGVDDGKPLFAQDKRDPLEDLEEVRFGVHLNRRSGFGSVRAVVRVWYFGEQVYQESLELDAQAGYDQFASFSSALVPAKLWEELRTSAREDWFEPDAPFDRYTGGPGSVCF
ncbi:MAG: hypothetical protein AAGI01_07785 [Myxococcota bacterium]